MRICVLLAGLVCAAVLWLSPRAGAAPSTPATKEAKRLADEAYAVRLTDTPLAVQKLRRALALYEGEAGPDDPHLVRFLDSIADGLSMLGDDVGTATTRARALAIMEKKHGPVHIDVGQRLIVMAMEQSRRGNAQAAALLRQRAQVVYEKLDSPKDPVLVHFLVTQAYDASGLQDYARAQALMERALQLAERYPDADNQLSNVLAQLAGMCTLRGQHAEAERHYRRLIPLTERLKQELPAITYVEQLARNLVAQGRAAEADPYWARAEAYHRGRVEAQEEKLKAAPADKNVMFELAQALDFTLSHLAQRDLWSQALPVAERKLALERLRAGTESLEAESAEGTLAEMLIRAGDYRRARALATHAQAVRIKLLGPSFAPSVTLESLARVEGRWADARAQSLLSEQVFVRLHGPKAMSVAMSRSFEARLWFAEGKARQALGPLREGLELMEPHIALAMSNGTEADKRQAVESASFQLRDAVAVHALLAPRDPAALELALTALLRRKGRALDAMSDSLGALRRRMGPEEQQLLDQLAAARARLAGLRLRQPNPVPSNLAQQVADLERRVRELELALAGRSSEFRATEATLVTIAAVQAGLPDEGVLIEMFTLQPTNMRSYRLKPDPAQRRYVAYVVPKKGAPGFADLGLVKDLDPLVGKLRAALSSPDAADVKQLARALDERALRPLRPLLGPARHLFLAPDGALNLVPFSALVDEQGRFAIQQYTISYLTSGRDLLRLRAQLPRRQPAAVIADPEFGERPAAGAPEAVSGRRSATPLSTTWGALPATAEEARAVAALLAGSTLLTGSRATEAALKRLAGPQVLHVATHGFFMPAQEGVAAAENPLLRSGLLLSGANGQLSEGEDGVLTALEASGLDLGGTQLVVLSACETGLGDVHGGDGVYGLRRALVLAGAEAQVMSLWQVDDNTTRDLMIGMYRRLRDGKGRAEALRQAQLRLLAAPESQHPYYWAAFITSGAWGPLRAQ